MSTKIWHKWHWRVIKWQGVGGLDEYNGVDLSRTKVDGTIEVRQRISSAWEARKEYLKRNWYFLKNDVEKDSDINASSKL